MVLYNALTLPRAAGCHDPCTCAHGVYGKFICARRRASEERSVLIVREYRATADNNTASLVATLPTGAHSAQGKFARARRQASEARSVLIVREHRATAGNNALADFNQRYAFLPQQCLNFFPLPQGHGSFLPTFGCSLRNVSCLCSLSGITAPSGISPSPAASRYCSSENSSL